MLLPATGHAAEFGGFRVESVEATPPYDDAPSRVVDWLRRNPQDIVILNGCEQADIAVPHVPAGTRVVYVVHDTADRYFEAAVRNEDALDAIVAISETVASRFRCRLKAPERLHIALNGTIFPVSAEAALSTPRENDLIFLGGDKPFKGSFDALSVWSALQARGFVGRLHWFGHIGNDLSAEIARTRGAERILLHGRKPRQQIFETAARSRLMLMLSRVEPFGMVTVECMGMGCLAAAWDIDTGTREIITPGECAFAPLGDYGQMADGILELLAVHESRFRDSTMRIRTAFDDSAMWARYSRAFDSMQEQEPASRPLSLVSPPPYRPPVRIFQLLPTGLRQSIRDVVGRSPRLGYLLRDLRGR
jgi:glycosyltransferase involved in cell wall biosynthesis